MFDEGGGGGIVQTDTALLTDAAREAGGTAELLDTLLRNLMDNLSPLVTAWQGDGGTAFQSVRIRVEEEMRKLNNALHFLSDEVGLASADYVVTDEEMAETMTAAGATDGEISRLLEGIS